ncbi:type I polyketide synthase [Streptomyces telluris]|uniref:Aminotransferase class I/II-fold pyridoxal phosphate-dependent enzyme n=1 Tax=Streptomyces telluris TaxID=2720021 RepID=A0A9X2LE41_9ACTN|nr:type I polyketide synthase [Streptomyces telluris]MCQ8769406.1 aminotransferase class I/II-fold pyridoxal phosphate-dependent enzyme [Streptomyces telluris]
MSRGPIGKPWPGGEPETVAALLRHRADRTPDALAYRFLPGADDASESWSYGELDLRARTVAGRLLRENLAGRPVLLLHPPGLDYIAAFFGCLYAGAIAVPAYPPDSARFGQTMPRLAAIARDSGATHAYTTADVREAARARPEEISALGLTGLTWLTADDLGPADAEAWHEPGTGGGSLAFLQYTSGSTSDPKGVMVTHTNLVRNLRSIHLRLEHDEDSGMVSWLPPYHDMGLIGGILTPLYGGFPAHLMAPATFVRRPLLWLETLSRTGASTSVAPNFGFEQCLRRITDEQRDALDLSTWRLALNGAEPVRAETLERFADRFAPCGFDRRALLPCYGLAEGTLMVTGIGAAQPPVLGAFDTGALARGAAEPAAQGAERTTRVVGCGTPVPDVEVAVVDPDTRRRAPDGRVGEIWVAGPNVAEGYWGRPEATEESFGARIAGEEETAPAHLRTGDLGFLRDGQLYVVGRTKDVVIVQGRNHYPHDVELTAEKATDAVRPGCGAAFGIPTEQGEQLALAYEFGGGDPAAALAALRTAVAEEHQVAPHTVVLLKRSTVPKTTSGKIQRQACRAALTGLELSVVAASVLRDDAGPPSPAARPGREQAVEAVARVLGRAAGPDGGDDDAAADRGFAELGLDYAGLLDAVGALEREFGVTVPVGELLVRPHAATLVELLVTDGAGEGADPNGVTPTADEAGEGAFAKAPGAVTTGEGLRAGAPGGEGPHAGAPASAPRAAAVEAWLAARIAGRLGLRASAIDRDLPFTSLGLDSRQAVAVTGELGAWLGRELPAGLVFEHPSVRALAARLGAQERPRPTAVPAAPAAPAPGEPVAIVGMGCRFPGAPDVDSYWRLLLDGRDAVGEVPRDRWDPGLVDAPRHGGFLDRVDAFDARFFGISAREAERMDPQQRLLLEVAWQAFEDAHVTPAHLAGSETGVFVGISSHDYAELQMPHLESVDVYSATGNAQSVAANRLSYHFDLAGPSLAVDTACSSSLAAVHMACQSLRAGECRTALAGGVNLLITPGLSVAFAQGGMLSADGRCRTFDDAADGYVRGEGVGLVLLKPLSAALADGDRVHAVIRGSALGHGGRSNGLTAPKGSAQRTVMARALARAGLEASAVGYVEAHGTGTALGDPVEWGALAGVYGQGRAAEEPCLVGSVKTNIGHLEAAAGIAGLIKAALVTKYRQVPPSLHLTRPNRGLEREGAGLEVATDRRALPVRDAARAGVSSFGFGGANAHVVLEAAPEVTAAAPAAGPVRPRHALCLSGHTSTALAALARHYRTHLAAHPDADLRAVCRSANTGRAHLAHRAVLTGASAADLDAALEDLVRERPSTAAVRGHVPGRPEPKVAFLFSGQGTQYPGMAKELYGTHEGFTRTLDRADAVLRPLLGTPLTRLLFDEDGAAQLRSTRYCQAALVALEAALAGVWTSLGVRPAAVLGHSAGAIAAAAVAGAVSLEDALALAAERGRLMDAQPGDGAMIACVGDPGAVRAVAGDFASVAVAAVNTGDHLVLSGGAAEIAAAGEALRGRGVTVRPLVVSHAFHSPLMAGAAEPLREAAGRIAFAEPAVPWVSDATGELTGRPDAGYWRAHMLGTVRFADGFATLRRLGCDAFVEVGPHPTLLNLGRSMTAAEPGAADVPAPLWLPTLRRGGDAWESLLQSLGRLHCAGGAVDWAALDGQDPPRHVPVPHAVLERESYWFTAPAERARRSAVTGPEPSSAPRPVRQEPYAPAAGGAVAEGSVLGHIARICGFPAEQIPPYARLGVDLGFDSLMRTDLQRSIAAQFPDRMDALHRDLPEDPTVRDLVDRLGDGGGPVPQAPAAPAPAPAPAQAVPPLVPRPARPAVKQEYAFEEWAEYAELQGRLRQARSGGSNPYGRSHEGFNSAEATIGGRKVVNFAAFNYLALSGHPQVRQAAKEAIDQYGTSASATPLLFGETPLHHELDAEIASFLGTEAAIVFAGGHATNVATVGHLFGPEDLIVHDEWSHDSTVRGCVLSGARRRPFPHNDWEALDRILTALRGRHRRALVVIEGAYSQDGDIPDLPRFIEVKQRHGAMLMIDEAHSVGVLGETGRGIGEHFAVDRADVDLWMGTLSKAIGSLGGYIAAREPIVEYLRFTAPLHIFSTGISPANAAAALEAIRVVRKEPQRVTRLRELSDFFRAGARERGLDIGVSRASAVIPVITGDWEKTMALSNSLLERGVNVMPIGYPAVERDKCRLRFFVNVDHTEVDLETSLDLLV